ncbi:MAG: NADPH-dependent F420 reductase [Actinobacteria bacterium]|nr:NADPH-dependent F420 reductase [Actinomycetota bacterium]
MQIGILGATGPAGSGLAARLASVGFDVIVGSRSKYKAMEVRDRLCDHWQGRELSIDADDNPGAANADIVVIATPWDAAGATAASVSRQLEGKVVISMANALAKVGTEFQPLVPPRGSVAASVQAAVPKSLVAAAFHHVPAKELGDLGEPVESDVLICSDHPTATAATVDIVTKIPSMRALDAGQLSNAAPIEAFAAVLLQLNVKYKTRVAVQFTGLRDV